VKLKCDRSVGATHRIDRGKAANRRREKCEELF
jgi:hypothetical protein